MKELLINRINEIALITSVLKKWNSIYFPLKNIKYSYDDIYKNHLDELSDEELLYFFEQIIRLASKIVG